MQQLAAELVDELTGMGHLADAATVAADYLSDADNAVALLSQARQWREALRTAYRYGTRGAALKSGAETISA